MINTRDIVEEYRYSSNEKKSVCRKNYKATYGFFYTIHVYLGKIFCTILGMIFLAKSPHDGISRPTNDLAHICRPFCDAPTNYTLRADASTADALSQCFRTTAFRARRARAYHVP